MTPFERLNRITSPYGYREYIYNGKLVKETHRGYDIVPTQYPGEAVPESAWNVREVTGGIVLRIAYDNVRGNYVDIQTAPGTFERYQHLKSVAVKVGQTIKQGDVIAVAGSTGQSTGRHLHFGVYVGGNAEANAVIPSEWVGLPNKAGTYPGNNDRDGQEDKRYKATVLVDGLRLRPYPAAEDDNANTAIASLEKGKVYTLKQTRGGWAFLLTENGAGGWASMGGGEYIKVLGV